MRWLIHRARMSARHPGPALMVPLVVESPSLRRTAVQFSRESYLDQLVKWPELCRQGSNQTHGKIGKRSLHKAFAQRHREREAHKLRLDLRRVAQRLYADHLGTIAESRREAHSSVVAVFLR